MPLYIIEISIFLLGFFTNSQATEFILQNQADLAPFWTSNCDYFNKITELFERNCMKTTLAVAEKDGGYWTPCDNATPPIESCKLTFTIPEDFEAKNITIFAYNIKSDMHVDTSFGRIGSIPSTNYFWNTFNFQILPELLSPDRQINFIIDGFGDGIFDKIIIQGDQFTSNSTACDPNNCTHTGYCHSFNRCTRAGLLEHVPCPKDINGHSLWWNSEKNTEHGGSCDIWSGLSLTLQERYLGDPACDTPCEYIPQGRCSPNYSFIKLGRSFDLTCGPELVFNPEIETCDYCYNIQVEGGNCCGLGDPIQNDATTGGPFFVFTVVNGFDDPDDQYDLLVPTGGQCFTIPPEREMDHRHEVNTNGRCFIIYLNNDCTGTSERFEASTIKQNVNDALYDQFLSIRTC